MTGSLKGLYQFYQSFTRRNTYSKVLILDFAIGFGRWVKPSYKQWLEGVCRNDFTKGIDFLANIASFHVKSLTSNKSQKGKSELKMIVIPQPLSEFTRHSLKDDRDSKDSSQNNRVAQSQGIKGSLVALVRDAIKISEEKVYNDSDHNWKHLKSPVNNIK